MRFSRFALLFVTAFAGISAADTINGTLTGTCGFYQGTRSNVVYSQTFSGDGTFCTGFMAGGSFTQSSIFQVGDIYASGYHNTVALAPSGYGVFATFDDTLQVTQQYLIEPTFPSSTPTGTVSSFSNVEGYPDDGSGSGSCETTASVDLAGHTVFGSAFTFPVAFGQPVSAVETVRIQCNEYALKGWGDEGLRKVTEEPILVYDANGNLLGPAIVTTVPEPRSVWLTGLLALPLLVGARWIRGYALGCARS